jgi:hypothetical protein
MSTTTEQYNLAAIKPEMAKPGFKIPDSDCPFDFKTLQGGLEPDPLKMEHEVMQSPVLCQMVSDETARRGLIYEHAERYCDYVEFKVDLAVREELKATGEKVTEKAVEARVSQNGELMYAQDAKLMTNFEYRRWKGLEQAYFKRHESIKILAVSQGRSMGAYTPVGASSD